MGSFAPHADQTKFRSNWACIEGDNDGRWPSVREAKDGLRIGNDGRKKLAWQEFQGADKKPHDIIVGKTKLREMIAPVEDILERDRYEGACSTRAVENFTANTEEKTKLTKGRAELSTTFETH